MSIENVTKFLQLASTDSQLRAKIQSVHAEVGREVAEKISALSAEAGTPFTVDEFLAQASPVQAELSDEQLAGVAGGGDIENFFASIMTAFALGKCDPPREEATGPYANYKPRGWK